MQDLVNPFDTTMSLKISCANTKQLVAWPDGLPNQLKQSLNENGTCRVFQKGDPVSELMHSSGSICVVVSGAVKAQVCDADGTVTVLGFYLQGDLLGFDSSAMGDMPYEAIALCTTRLFILPMDKYWQLSEQPLVLAKYHTALMGRALREANRRTALIGNFDSDQKLAYFLLNIAARMHHQNYARYHFNLPMSRVEMSQYLFVTAETISRTLTRFQSCGYLTVKRTEIHIIEPQSLLALLYKQPAPSYMMTDHLQSKAL